jgi:hypothetical protein
MKFRFRNFLILGTILAAVSGTWVISSLSVLLVRDEWISRITVWLFGGTTLIAMFGLASWLIVALMQLWNHENNSWRQPKSRKDLIVHSPQSGRFHKGSGIIPANVTFVPSRLKPVEILEKDDIDSDLLSHLVEGEVFNDGE